MFVTTKLAADCKRYADAKARSDGSLQALDVDYIDLMLIHSPQPWSQFRQGEQFFEGNLEAWRALEEAYDYAQSKGILVEAYSPVAHGEILRNAELAALAAKYEVCTAQLCIRYCLQLGMLPLPKTVNPSHMRSNAAVDFEISEADMETLNNAKSIKDYGEATTFPVFGRRRERGAVPPSMK